MTSEIRNFIDKISILEYYSSNKRKWKVIYSFTDDNNQSKTCGLSLYASNKEYAMMYALKDAKLKNRVDPHILSISELSNNEIREGNILESYFIDVSHRGIPINKADLLRRLEKAVGRRKDAAGHFHDTFFCSWSFTSKEEATEIANTMRQLFPKLQISVTSMMA